MSIREAQIQSLFRTLARSLLLAFVMACLCATSLTAQDSVERKRVLIVYGNDSTTPSLMTLDRTIRSILKNGSPIPVETYSEYIGDTRAGKDYEKEWVSLVQRKYEGKKFDVIFATTQSPLRILLRHRAELFPGTPIVFLTHDQRSVANIYPAPGVTGVWGEIHFKLNLELALALHPGTSRVVVIGGASDFDKSWVARAQEDFRAYESRLEFTYLIGLTVQEMRTALAGLPSHTIVFFVTSIRDNAGNIYDSPEFLKEISPVSTAPIYGSTDAQLGQGIVGGRLLSFEALGTEGAQIGLRVLAGENPEAIAPHGIPSTPMFDSRELKRWGIEEASLPPGTIVRFEELTFWERYRWRIIAASALIILQAVLIAVLLFERKRRQRAREALHQLNAELEERIAARTAALKNKSRELETFAYTVAHDLKAPLRGIDGYSRLLVEEYSKDLPDEARSFIKTIKTSGEEMGQLIDDLLAYSLLERREFKPDRLELYPLISTLVDEKRRESADRNIDFVVNIDGSTVVTDSKSLIQSLRNYLDNAVKFTSQTPEPLIEVGSKETATGCCLWVRDNGIGFDSKHSDQIFGIFQRLNSSDKYPGTGIGLAIVGKAMERMGGRAWAESEPGMGATFYLEIPKVNKNGG